MTDLTRTIIPRSDQTNAEDLVTGPRTITITKVAARETKDQPIAIHYDGDDGRPYLPCKSMRRLMVAVWGADGSKYVGRQLRIFCDPKVKWGGIEVGGIRISHMSHINGEKQIALTVTRGNKRPYTVKPITASQAAGPSAGADTPAADGVREEARDSSPADNDLPAKTLQANDNPDDGFPGDRPAPPKFTFSVKASNGDVRTTADSELWAKTLEGMLRKAADTEAAQAVWDANKPFIDAAERGGFTHFAQRVWVAATQRGVQVEGE